MRFDVLSIGVDNYFDANGWLDTKLQLSFAASDATRALAIARAIFDVRKSWLLSDSCDARTRPTRNDIIRALRVAANTDVSDATLLVYFAGHGVGIGGSLHLCPADYDYSIKEYSSLGLDLICDILSERTGKKCLILDCCRAPLDKSDGDWAKLPSRIRLPTSEDVAILAGCSSGQSAFESSSLGGGGGVFSHFLLTAFEAFARNSAGAFFSLADVFRESRDNTTQYVFDELGAAMQKPIAFGADLDEFLLSGTSQRAR